MMLRKLSSGLAFLLFTAFSMSGQSPCLTSEASLELAKQYPQGVPGRYIPTGKAAYDDPYKTYVIPVVFHVFHTGGPEGFIDSTRAEDQISSMNQSYGRYGIGYNEHPDGGVAGIRFALAKRAPNGDTTSGVVGYNYLNTFNFGVADEDSLKHATQWDPCRYLNIWVMANISGTIVGYAYFPDQVACTWYDGIVIETGEVGQSEHYELAKGQGDNITHEAGHYLGLDHTWGRDNSPNCDEEDHCEDTPLCSGPYFSDTATNCFAPIQCGVTRQVENYMDYSNDYCKTMFSRCQIATMRYNIVTYRPTLVSTENLIATGVADELDSVMRFDSLEVYPNPANDFVFIYNGYDNKDEFTLEIYDLKGAQIRSYPIGNAKAGQAIDLTNLDQGFYHFVFRNSTRYLRKTIMVKRND
jgi:hypothetical protein